MWCLLNNLAIYLAVGIGLPATNMVGFDVEPRWGSLFFTHSNPVCASRHWALEWNCVAVHSRPDDVNESLYCPNQAIQSSGFYANGVKLRSPASRSARWVADHPHHRTPTGFHNESTFHHSNTPLLHHSLRPLPLGGFARDSSSPPPLRPGYGDLGSYPCFIKVKA